MLFNRQHKEMLNGIASEKYCTVIAKYKIHQSMNSAGGRCHDNARYESMWTRMKEESFYLQSRKS